MRRSTRVGGWQLFTLLAVGAVGLGLGGCKRTKASGAVTELRLQLFGDPVEVQSYREMVAAFERANPDIKVQLIPLGRQADHMAKLTTAFSGGTPPDLFLLNYRRYGQFAAKGVLEPLGPRLAKSQVLKESDLFEKSVEAFRFGGELTCLPQNISSLVVYYNRALFREAGLPPPSADWTWEDLRRTAKALTRDTDGDGRTDVYGLGFEPTLNRITPFVWQAGGEVVDSLHRPRQLTLGNTPALEALRFLLELRRVDGVTPPLEESKSEKHDARFANGRLGMLLNSRRLVPSLRDVPRLDWDVAPLPRGREAASMLHSDAYCMSRASPSKDAAFRFVEYALGPVGAEMIARSGRTVPSLRKVAESAAFLEPGRKPESARVFLDAIPLIRRVPSVAEWNEVETRADPIIEEWYYAVPEGGTKLGERAPAPAAAGPGGSMRRILKLRDEVNTLGFELSEATRTVFHAARHTP